MIKFCRIEDDAHSVTNICNSPPNQLNDMMLIGYSYTVRASKCCFCTVQFVAFLG